MSFWTDGTSARIVVVTPGFRLVALDARTGRPVSPFGADGMVDLKRSLGRGGFDPLAPIVSSSPVVISNDIIVVGPALELGFHPKTMANVPGFVRGFDVRVGTRTVKAVAVMTKQAFTCVFDRVSGEPVWPIVECAVPKSDVPGERTAATQPFPTNPPAFDGKG